MSYYEGSTCPYNNQCDCCKYYDTSDYRCYYNELKDVYKPKKNRYYGGYQ